jgi:hypothetical protein
MSKPGDFDPDAAQQELDELEKRIDHLKHEVETDPAVGGEHPDPSFLGEHEPNEDEGIAPG